MKKILLMLVCLLMCLIAGCGKSSDDKGTDVVADVGEIDVATISDSAVAFDNAGYYHVWYANVTYVDSEHQDQQKKEIYAADNMEGLLGLMYHQESLYVISVESDMAGDQVSDIWRIKSWNADQKEEKCVVEEFGENLMIYSMAAVGNTLYYTVAFMEEDLQVGATSYNYGRTEVWSVNLDSGEKERILELEGSKEQFSNALILTNGNYEDSETLLVRYEYAVLDESGEVQGKVDSYHLNLHTQKIEKMEACTINGSIDAAYVYQNLLYYCEGNGEKTDYKYMDINTGEIKTVLTSDMYGLMTPEYVSFTTYGKESRRFLYYYKDGKLLVSAKEASKTPRIIGANKQYVALNEMDYSKRTDDQTDQGIYKIAENDSFVKEYYKEYAGECSDTITYFGLDGGEEPATAQ